MKKRTLVCFLIFTLCVFYTAIPNTVFGQEEEASLAEQVLENHGETLIRPEIQGGFLIVLDVLEANPTQAAFLNPGTIEAVIANPALLDGFIDRDTLTDVQIAALDQFLPLLVAKDEGVLALLRDEQVLELLKDPDAIRELKGKLAAETPPDDGTTPPDDGTTPPDDGTTPPDDGTTPPDDGTTPPDDGTTPPDDGTTPPDDGTTPPDDGTTPPDDGTTPPGDDVAPPPVGPLADPFEPIAPTNLSGKSRLGGLALNKISGRKFLADLVMTATGYSFQEVAALSGQTQKELVELVVELIPDEVPLLDKKQLLGILNSDNVPIFAGNLGEQELAQGLDTENFGNAIVPMPIELFYDDGMGDQTDPNRKYLTRDSLNLYVRVPSVNVGGVKFGSSDGTLEKEGRRVSDPTVLGSETIPYTFRLEEALAATNLPAWPALEDNLEQLFSEVTLRYSDELDPEGGYTGYPMSETFTENGVVWETEVHVTQGNSFYYFDVTLATPVTLDVLDREKLEGLYEEGSKGNVPSVADILNATLNPPLEIEKWSMPDPRNLQLADRGILAAVFNDDFQAALLNAAGPLLISALSGEQITVQEILNALGKHQARLQGMLLENAGKVITKFESGFDPMLSSVFSVPKFDPESESLWVASFDDIDEGNYFVGAVVYDEAGNPLDQMWSDVTVDTKAPEADVKISAGDNTTVYENIDGVYVATALKSGPATLNITGILDDPSQVAQGYGYLLYQILRLNPDGTPYQGASSLQSPNTWMPLTPEATMLASTIWEQTIRQLALQGALPEKIDLPPIAQPILGVGEAIDLPEELTLKFVSETVLPLLATPIGLGFIENDPTLGPAIKGLSDFLGGDLLDPDVVNLLVEVFGATVDLINYIPITYGSDNNVTMLAQLGEDVLAGNYGIRALGIDTLFNVSSHTAPTQLRIVDSSDPVHHDRASVMSIAIGDCNLNGKVDSFESGAIGDVTIYNNTTDNVVLTVKVDHRSPHPATVSVQYMDAAGVWQEIENLDLDGSETGSTLTVNWNVTDFDALLGGKEMGEVMVRAEASNALQLTDLDPMVGTINLDAGICPLEPEVIAITLEPIDPAMKNPDSGGRQGEITLTAYTPSRTLPMISSVHLNATGPEGKKWEIAVSEPVEHIEGQELANILEDLVSTVGSGKPIHVNSMYQKWMVTIDTTTLKDTITADSPAARDASKDENQYVVTGYAVAEFPALEGVEARFSVDNVDDVAPLGPTNISVTSVEATDSTFESGDDGSSYTVGGLVDKYDEAVPSPMATLTIEPTADRMTYESVKVMTDAENLVIGEVTETAENSGVFEVTVDVGTLADGETYLENGTYMFHALAVDVAGNVQDDMSETDGSKISVAVENTYRPDPEILAISVDPESITETNPDSGAPQGTLTIHAYSHEISSPPTTSVRIEVKRSSDTEWIKIENTATESVATTEVSDANLADFVGDLANAAVNAAEAGESEAVPINRTYQMWAIDIDTTMLEDTITKDSPAARDASKDDNRYMVRAYAVAEAEQSETVSADGITAMFSVDNVDDVPPVGPTNIVNIADVAGDIAAADDGSYTVGGIVDDTVSSPIATFTIQPTADPATYELVKLVQTASDGTETITKGEAGVLDITIDVGMLENGAYTFHALAVDKDGNIQEDDSPMVTVHVLNFRVSDITDLAVIAVDGTDVAEAPTGTIPLRDSVTVSFMVANGSLAAEELSGEVNGGNVPSESAEDPENTFSLMVALKSPADDSPLADGVYTPDGLVTKRNGSVRFPLTAVNLDNTGPMITIESPTDGEAVDSLPTIHATYQDGDGIGVDGATGSLTLVRMQPPDAVEVVVDQASLEKDAEDLVYTLIEQLPGGAYTVTIEVADLLGTVGTMSREFTVNGTVPTVAIHSPAAGHTFDHGEPLISGEFSGAGTIEVTTFTINDLNVTPVVDGNLFSYTPGRALADGSYTVVVAVTDSNGSMAQTSVTFMVNIPEPPKDTTPPVISAVAPVGIIKDPDVDKAGSAKISAVVTDEQSAVSSVKYSVNGGQLRSIAKSNIVNGKIEAPIDFAAHGPGLYNVRLVATSEGGTTEHTWSFTLVVDNIAPAITSITPSGTIRGGLPVISASANDDSGVSKMTITVWDSDGEEVKGKTADDGESDVEGVTRLDFNLEAPLDEGVYTIEVRATDPYNNSASAKGTFSIDFDTAAPVITMASPQNEARLTDRRPLISITYADAESGVDADSIRFIFNSNVINLKPNQKTASQVLYRPEADLPFGQHTVKLEVSDMAHKEGNVSEKSKGAREANMAAYEFTFFVESVEGPILVARPINVPNPFKDETHISFALTRQSTVSIAIYDSTLRPVRVLMENKVMDAGNYFGKDGGILWNGKSSGDGEDLARGIYFCQIIVGDSIEPEYAILKLALTR